LSYDIAAEVSVQIWKRGWKAHCNCGWVECVLECGWEGSEIQPEMQAIKSTTNNLKENNYIFLDR
jgi:hypothetical protein